MLGLNRAHNLWQPRPSDRGGGIPSGPTAALALPSAPVPQLPHGATSTANANVRMGSDNVLDASAFASAPWRAVWGAQPGMQTSTSGSRYRKASRGWQRISVTLPPCPAA